MDIIPKGDQLMLKIPLLKEDERERIDDTVKIVKSLKYIQTVTQTTDACAND